VSGPTLTQVLRALGYHHVPGGGLYAQIVVRNVDGEVVFSGRAGEVWAWLKGVQ